MRIEAALNYNRGPMPMDVDRVSASVRSNLSPRAGGYKPAVAERSVFEKGGLLPIVAFAASSARLGRAAVFWPVGGDNTGDEW